MVIVGSGTEEYLTVSGTGSVFRNAISTDKNGDSDYEMVYTKDVRDEQITVAVESTVFREQSDISLRHRVLAIRRTWHCRETRRLPL